MQFKISIVDVLCTNRVSIAARQSRNTIVQNAFHALRKVRSHCSVRVSRSFIPRRCSPCHAKRGLDHPKYSFSYGITWAPFDRDPQVAGAWTLSSRSLLRSWSLFQSIDSTQPSKAKLNNIVRWALCLRMNQGMNLFFFFFHLVFRQIIKTSFHWGNRRYYTMLQFSWLSSSF